MGNKSSIEDEKYEDFYGGNKNKRRFKNVIEYERLK